MVAGFYLYLDSCELRPYVIAKGFPGCRCSVLRPHGSRGRPAPGPGACGANPAWPWPVCVWCDMEGQTEHGIRQSLSCGVCVRLRRSLCHHILSHSISPMSSVTTPVTHGAPDSAQPQTGTPYRYRSPDRHRALRCRADETNGSTHTNAPMLGATQCTPSLCCLL